MLSVTRALRALVRLRTAEAAVPQEDGSSQARLTPLPAVDPPPEQVQPIGDPVTERAVDIPLYLEP